MPRLREWWLQFRLHSGGWRPEVPPAPHADAVNRAMRDAEVAQVAMAQASREVDHLRREIDLELALIRRER